MPSASLPRAYTSGSIYDDAHTAGVVVSDISRICNTLELMIVTESGCIWLPVRICSLDNTCGE